MNGKGAKRRPGDSKKYRENYDKIFNKQNAPKTKNTNLIGSKN